MCCCVVKDGSRHTHDCLYGPFGDTVVVVCAYSSELVDLAEALEVLVEVRGGECRAIVADERLWDHSIVAAEGFVRVFRLECFVGVQVSLMDDVDVSCGVIHKDASTCVSLVIVFLAISVWKATFYSRHKMVHTHTLSRVEVALAKFESLRGVGD